MSEIEIRRAADAEDLEELAPIVGWAFGVGTGRALEWLQTVGAAHVRVACVRGRVGGGLVEIPMGQWFGGQSVPTLGLAGVSIAPEARGQGLALRLVGAALRAAREGGIALSTLYPSTFGLYRKAGYEIAGSHGRFTLQLRQLPRTERPLAVDALDEHWHSVIEGCYREVARQHPGYLDRGAYVWNRVRRPDQESARAFGVLGRAGLEGYMYLRPVPQRRMSMELALSDFVVHTPEALASCFAFLADHLTTAERATWTGSACDTRLLGLPERAVQCSIEDYWMLRLVDVRAALLARGYPSVDAALDLRVEDSFLPDNSGIHALRVERGKPRIETPAARTSPPGAGGVPQLSISAGALAALYSGYASARQLAFSRQLEADAGALEAASLLFSGPAPGLPDFF